MTLPVPLRVVHASRCSATRRMPPSPPGGSAPASTCELTGVAPEEYYETIEKPTSVDSYDVFRGVWTPDWPSAGGVLPALFDPRINIDSSGPGPGRRLLQQTTPSTRSSTRPTRPPTPPPARRVWEQADRRSATRAATSRSSATKALYLHGAGVKTYEDHSVGGIVDLATVSVR